MIPRGPGEGEVGPFLGEGLQNERGKDDLIESVPDFLDVVKRAAGIVEPAPQLKNQILELVACDGLAVLVLCGGNYGFAERLEERGFDAVVADDGGEVDSVSECLAKLGNVGELRDRNSDGLKTDGRICGLPSNSERA